MGIIVGGALVFGLVASAVLGLIGIGIHTSFRKRGRGTWLMFLLIAVVATIAVNIVVAAAGPSAHSGAPTGDDYQHWMSSAFWLGASPGIGAIVGNLAALSRSGRSRRF